MKTYSVEVLVEVEANSIAEAVVEVGDAIQAWNVKRINERNSQRIELMSVESAMEKRR